MEVAFCDCSGLKLRFDDFGLLVYIFAVTAFEICLFVFDGTLLQLVFGDLFGVAFVCVTMPVYFWMVGRCVDVLCWWLTLCDCCVCLHIFGIASFGVAIGCCNVMMGLGWFC